MRKSNDGLLDRKVMRALGVPAGSTHLLKQARKNRSDAMSSNDYRFLGKVQKKRLKVSEETWNKIRENFIPTCKYVKDIPSVNEQIIKRDMFQKIKRDNKNEPIRTRKMVIWDGLREAHNLVIDSEENGGCALARDNEGRVIISCTALRRY